MAERWALSEIPLVKRLLGGRWLQWSLTVITLAVFLLVILSGLFGTPAGNHNFGIIYVWLVWWALLKLVFVPFLGRFWCSICPIPAPGDWLQRRAMITPRPGGRLYTIGQKIPRRTGSAGPRRWPKFLRSIWAQNFGFLAVALFSALILTSPLATALTLLGFIAVSLVVSLFFERRAFCRYLCPIGGFVGVYGQVAPLAVRVKDPAVCQNHRQKTCFTGSDAGYGCPYFNLPQNLETNTLCSMCGECLRTCTEDNVAFYVQPPGADLRNTRGRRLDEALNGLMMLGAAFIYSVVLLGPNGWLKVTARAVGTPGWFLYAAVLLLFSVVLVPGLFWFCVRLGQALAGKPTNVAAGIPDVVQRPPAMLSGSATHSPVQPVILSGSATNSPRRRASSEESAPSTPRPSPAPPAPALARSAGAGVRSAAAQCGASVADDALPRVSRGQPAQGDTAQKDSAPATLADESSRGRSGLFSAYATTLVPLGLAIWIAFTLSFTLTNVSYAWPALSDPFGWGWDLFGTASMAWTPYLSGVIPYLQVPVLLIGLVAAVALALRTAHQHGQRSLAALPVSAFCALAVVALLTLYMA